jgi:hypothetical protein
MTEEERRERFAAMVARDIAPLPLKPSPFARGQKKPFPDNPETGGEPN